MASDGGRTASVAGAGGALCSAALRALLADARYGQVIVLTTCRFLQVPSRLAYAVVDDVSTQPLPAADHAVIVLGATRRAREVVYWQPARDDLLPLAASLRASGVRSLEVVLASGGGLSPVQRDTLAGLAFDLVEETLPGPLPRPARRDAPWPERLALWLIHTLIATLRMAQAAYRERPEASGSRRRL